MLFTMWINLWATRLVLANLGVEDYGIYGVVGGVVSMFAVLNGGMTNAVNRFLAYEQGKKEGDLNLIFCNCVNIVVLLSIITAIILECVGLWFLQNKLQIPATKMDAAFWVFQFSTIVCIVNILSIPYNAMIIAKEKMGAFAYISIIQVVLNFISVCSLKYISENRLFWYALFLLFVAVIFRLINQMYCRLRFKESRYHFGYSSAIIKSIGQFVGYSMFDGIVNVIFSFANQVRGYVLTFSQNIQKAIEPQIIKNYAANDDYHFNQLISKGSMFQMVLSLMVMIPLLIRTQQILELWLGAVPEHLCHFVRIVIFMSLIYAVTCPVITGALATGKIKQFLLVGNVIYVIALIGFYLLSLKGISVDCLVVGFVLIEFIIAFYRVYRLSVISNFKVIAFIRQSFLPCTAAGLITFIIMIYLNNYISYTVLGLLFHVCVSCALITVLAYLLCLSKNERKRMNSLVIKTIKNRLSC